MFDHPYGEQILPKIQLAFLIFHIVPTALCANPERSLAPSQSPFSALAFVFAGLGEVPDGPFLGLKVSGLLWIAPVLDYGGGT